MLYKTDIHKHTQTQTNVMLNTYHNGGKIHSMYTWFVLWNDFLYTKDTDKTY